MASIRKVPGSKYWIACYTTATGRRLQRSTKETKRKDALQIAETYERAYRVKMTEAQIRRVLADAYQQAHGTPLASSTVADYAKRWLQRKEVELRGKSLADYRSKITDFQKFLENKAQDDLTLITASDVTRYRDATAKRLTTRSANNALKVIRVFFQAAYCEGLITDNPARKVPVIKKRDALTERRPFTVEEIKRILEAADEQWRGMVLLGLYTGQRLRDIAALTWANIDLAREEIRLTTSKTRRRQIIPMARPLVNYLQSRPSSDTPSDPLFPKAYAVANRPKASGQLSNQFYDLLAQTGFVPKRDHKSQGKGRNTKRQTNPVSFHCLRHTATSWLKSVGVSDAIAMEFVGHESAAVSQEYTHIETARLKEAADKLPDVLATVQGTKK